MKAKTTNSSAITIGIDLGDRKHSVCVLDAKGEILKQQSIANNRGSLTALSRRHPGALMVMEVGSHSPWTSRFLKALGHRVLVANPRELRAIYQNERKCDRKDAEMLARLARHARRILGNEHPQYLALVEASLCVLDALTAQIRSLEKSIGQMAAEKYPEAEFLTQVAGVGILTSLTFILTIGAFLGLVPGRDQSGDTDKQLRITKAGDSYLRKLLVQAAQYILGAFGPDTALRRKGLKLAERGGPRAKRKAVVAPVPATCRCCC